ncbi:biotin transport system substrate-specific component [Haloactinopolyspora alba]|uniref:Biotin transporter n=1 Tax=Haloactinopolyspora alba TaxID=648780 RepID=A0A2P8DKV5_9ACTN|nr:biotin transporter BioY [Haloactinopolyspora alba]PSK97854.1 biotin transport system substrate-specific component [Haloactinopolyspora alba]
MARPGRRLADRSRLSAADMSRVAVFAGLIAVLGVPGSFALFGNAVPVTLQSMGILLCGAILGARRGALAVLVLLALVATGLPLLAGGRGGLGVFAGPSVGYLAGWVAAAAVVGWLVERAGRRPALPWVLGACLTGSAVVLVIGVPVQSFVTGVPLGETMLISAAFLPGDAAKAVFAAVVTTGTQRAYPAAAPGARRVAAADGPPAPGEG